MSTPPSLKQLKKRVPGEVIAPEDHNDNVDNWSMQLDFDCGMVEVDPDIKDLVDELSSIVSSMRKVKYGDFVLADDHNKFVDAWLVQDQINKELSKLGKPKLNYVLVAGKATSVVPCVFEAKPRLVVDKATSQSFKTSLTAKVYVEVTSS